MSSLISLLVFSEIEMKKDKEEKLHDINRKHSFLSLGITICLVVLCIAMGFAIHANHEVEEIEHGEFTYSQPSLTYTDYDACTLDVLVTPRCRSKPSYVTHIPLSNGSCCTQGEDFCYNEDATKACVFGVCRSSDVTQCRGYCADDSSFTCNYAIPLALDPYNTFRADYCLFNSCVTYVMFADLLIADPLALVTDPNYRSCLAVTCTSQPLGEGATICLFTWRCAPFVDMSGRVFYGSLSTNEVKGEVNTTTRSHREAFLREAMRYFNHTHW